MQTITPAELAEMLDSAEADSLGLTLEDYHQHTADYAAWLDASAADLPDYP